MPKSTGLTRCTAQHPDGSFCDASSLEDAPFPICVKHAAQVYGHLDRAVASFAEADALPIPDVPDGAVVYYLAIGGLVKIGTTVNLARRLREYPPNVDLLATEPGGYAIETRRHRMFEHMRAYPNVSREWYVDAPALRADIARIGRGEAPLSVPPPREPHELRPKADAPALMRLDGLRRGGEGRATHWDARRTHDERSRRRANKGRRGGSR